MSILISILLAVWSLVALLMVLVILMQRPKSEGLGAAFGGAVTENIFGAQTTNVLVRFTGWLAGFFFLLTFLLSVLYAHHNANSDSALRQELMKTQATAPAALASPGASAPATTTSPAPAASVSATTAPAQSPLAAANPAVAAPAPVTTAPVAAPSASAAPSVEASATASPAASESPATKKRRRH